MDIDKAGNIQYIESPIDDLLEENFEEAFRDSLHLDESSNDRPDQLAFRDGELVNAEYLSDQEMANKSKMSNSNLCSSDQNRSSNPDASCSDFGDIAKYGIVDVSCDDAYGRKVITIYAYRLPANNLIDHNLLLKCV